MLDTLYSRMIENVARPEPVALYEKIPECQDRERQEKSDYGEPYVGPPEGRSLLLEQ